MKPLSQHILESLTFPEIVKEHLFEGIQLNKSYLRIDSDSYAEVLLTAKQLFESNEYVPQNESERIILEKLDSGKKAIYIDSDTNRRTEVKLDIPQPNPDRAKDKKRFIVYRQSDKIDKESNLPIAKKLKFASWDKGLDINNDDEGAVNSFWARQQCDKKNDPDKPGWWACYAPELFGDMLKLRGGKERW